MPRTTPAGMNRVKAVQRVQDETSQIGICQTNLRQRQRPLAGPQESRPTSPRERPRGPPPPRTGGVSPRPAPLPASAKDAAAGRPATPKSTTTPSVTLCRSPCPDRLSMPGGGGPGRAGREAVSGRVAPPRPLTAHRAAAGRLSPPGHGQARPVAERRCPDPGRGRFRPREKRRCHVTAVWTQSDASCSTAGHLVRTCNHPLTS